MTVDETTTYVFRDIIPKDYYWFALVENDFPDLDDTVQILLIICMLLDQEEDVLDKIPKKHIGVIGWWLGIELLGEKVMKLAQWYEVAFHLCKQRFDVSMEWLEEQPVPKITLMTQTLTKFAKEQEREMKKARRGK